MLTEMGAYEQPTMVGMVRASIERLNHKLPALRLFIGGKALS